MRAVLRTGLLLGTALTVPFAAVRADTIADKAQLCTACHGANGIPVDKNIPVIAGQQEGYLYLQLRDFKSGDRANDQMKAVTADMQREDMLAIAEYFSKQAWPNLAQPAAPADQAARAQQVAASIGCTTCHLEQYQGAGSQPRLAGQGKDYLARTMLDFRTGARANNPGMSDLMKAASPDDLPALAAYLAAF